MIAVVIGAGVIGLAVARELAQGGHEVYVLEKASAICTVTSSRNSEVIHAGMYYPTSSNKAAYCVAGRRQLYAFCDSHGVPYRKCGKLIVACSESETAKIEKIRLQGLENDVEGLTMLSKQAAQALEPNLSCFAVLESSETGIIDSQAYFLALQGDIEASGGTIAFKTIVNRIEPCGAQWRVFFGESDDDVIDADIVVNSAGLNAWDVAIANTAYPREQLPKRVYAKGNYFSCLGKPAFSRLIYPAPVEGGLGVHLTLDLQGGMRFGPDVEWLGQIDPDTVSYAVDQNRSDGFYAAIRTYWPGLPDHALQAAYSGIRPKLSGIGEAAADFMIEDATGHQLAGFINLFGIESPGLTSSLAIAAEVTSRVLATR